MRFRRSAAAGMRSRRSTSSTRARRSPRAGAAPAPAGARRSSAPRRGARGAAPGPDRRGATPRAGPRAPPRPRAARRAPRASGRAATSAAARRAAGRPPPRRRSGAARLALAGPRRAARSPRSSGSCAVVVPEPARDLADAQPLRGLGHAVDELRLRRLAVRGRSSEHDRAPTSDVAASTHSAVCMLWMNGSSCASDSPLASAGEDRKQHVLRHRGGDDRQHERDRDHRAGVLQHRPRAGRDAAPVRRDRAHHRGRVGRVEHARPDAHEQRATACSASTASRTCSVVMPASADRADDHAERGQRARAVAVGPPAGERRGDQHADRHRRRA